MQRRMLISLWSMWTLMLMATAPAAAETTISTGFRYDMFTDDHAPEALGYEATVPLGIRTVWNQLVLTLDSAYSSANVYPGKVDASKLSGLTDTMITAYYGLPNLPVGVIFGVDVNLPSGKERLTRRQHMAEAGEDHDLFEVDDFGEGWNLGFSVGAAEGFDRMSLGLNTTYRLHGEYDPTADVEDDTVNPGNQWLVSGLWKWQAASWLSVDAAASYSYFGADVVNGDNVYQEGRKISLSGTLQALYSIPKPLIITLRGQYAVQGKSQERQEGSLESEAKNSHGPQLFGFVDAAYRYSSRLSVTMGAHVKLHGKSDRIHPVSDLPYQGKRSRIAIGPGVTYTPQKNFSLTGGAKYFRLDQKKYRFSRQDTIFQGVNVAVGLTYTF